MKIERLLSIIMLLLQKDRIGAQELASMFEVSLRTIYRDIDSINMAGIPIRSIPGVGGGFEILQQYKVDKTVFSSADISAIIMGLTNLSNMMQGDELVNALAKVKSIIPQDNANDIELKANQLYIDLSPWMSNKNIQTYLEIIKLALKESKQLSFTYADRYGNITIRTVEPYQLVLKSSQWYFQGYCLERKDFRLFKLSRISNLYKQKESFLLREYKKPQLEFSSILTSMQTKIKIRIHNSIIDKVLDYCDYDNFAQDSSEYYVVNFPFIENDYYYSILFGFGEKCECIEPLHVREEIKRRIGVIAAIYTN